MALESKVEGRLFDSVRKTVAYSSLAMILSGCGAIETPNYAHPRLSNQAFASAVSECEREAYAKTAFLSFPISIPLISPDAESAYTEERDKCLYVKYGVDTARVVDDN